MRPARGWLMWIPLTLVCVATVACVGEPSGAGDLAAAAVAPTGDVRVAVIVATFSSYPPAPADAMDRARAVMGRVDAFYREQSYGQLRLTSDVYGLYTIPYSSSYSTNVSASDQAALDAGVDLSSYTAFYYLYPTGAPPGALANSYDSTFSNIAHELGHHIFGYYHHEHGIRCDSVTGTCASEEYGNRLSVMGLGQGHFSGMLKAGFGWLPPPQLIETSGDYTIEPLAAPPSGGAKTLTFNVCWSRWCTAYTLEYRQPIGFDDVPRSSTYDWNNVFGGVLFYGGSGSRLDLGTTLLQMTPYVIGTAQAPALAVGQSFCHKEGKVRVTVLSADATGARVRITYRTRCP